MPNVIFLIIGFIIIFCSRLYIFLNVKSKKECMELKYLENRFNLDKKKLHNKKIMILISVIDALIITVSLELSLAITKNFILEFIVGLIIIILLIVIVNEIIGRILKKNYMKRKD